MIVNFDIMVRHLVTITIVVFKLFEDNSKIKSKYDML